MAKETYGYGKTDLQIWQERYRYGEVDLKIWQNRPTDMARETYRYGKRDLRTKHTRYESLKYLVLALAPTLCTSQSVRPPR